MRKKIHEKLHMTDPVKKALRMTMREIRAKTSASYRVTASHQISDRILLLDQYRHAKHIALYFAINGEVDLEPLWKNAPLHGKFCYFPVLNEQELCLSFLPATPATSFKKNRYGILEPEVSLDAAIPVKELDLVLMPLVAFDARCTRLGMGAGYYDRTFKDQIVGALFGVAYQFQRVDFLEPYPWDIPLDAVITQRAIYWRNI